MNKTALALIAAALLGTAVLPTTSQAAGYTQTKYPIVLVHGLFGFDNIGPVEYFYGVSGSLRAGGAIVYTPAVSATNSTEVRGEQLLLEVKKIIAATGKPKVNLIGHSHGGPTVRYVAAVAPGLVASASSVAGVHKGSAVADVLLGLAPPGSISNTVIASAGKALATIISWLSGNPTLPQNALAAARSLSTAGATKFNASYPAAVPTTACGEGAYTVRDVQYFSWSGAKPFTNALDVLDTPIATVSLLFGGAKNDGLVASCSSHMGRVIRDDYAMNHLDEVNQTVGIVNLFETNPVTLYRQHANRLQALGL